MKNLKNQIKKRWKHFTNKLFKKNSGKVKINYVNSQKEQQPTGKNGYSTYFYISRTYRKFNY